MATSKKKASTKKPTQEQKPEDLENQNQENPSPSPSDKPAAAVDSSPESDSGTEDQGNLDLDALEGIDTEEVDQEAHREEHGPEPEQPNVMGHDEGRKLAGQLIAQGMNTTTQYVPELQSYFNDSMVADGAQKVGPVLVKHQGQMPLWLAKFISEYKEEFMAGVWFAGVAFGAYRHVKAEASKGQGGDNGSE